jgi:mRNA interferase MazF
LAVITYNLGLAAAPGNVMLRKRESRLANDSIVNVSQLVTLGKDFLTRPVAQIPQTRIREVEGGLRLVLSL